MSGQQSKIERALTLSQSTICNSWPCCAGLYHSYCRTYSWSGNIEGYVSLSISRRKSINFFLEGRMCNAWHENLLFYFSWIILLLLSLLELVTQSVDRLDVYWKTRVANSFCSKLTSLFHRQSRDRTGETGERQLLQQLAHHWATHATQKQ